jgi:hypothetical protein
VADEITLTAKLRFEKGDTAVFFEEVAASFTVAGTKYVKRPTSWRSDPTPG